MPDSISQRAHLLDILTHFDTAMLVTGASLDRLHGRPMAVVELQASGLATFATRLSSEKVAELQANPRALLTFQGSARFASVTGSAEIVQDRAKIARLWQDAWRVWVPGGQDDPDLCLVRVRIEAGEYWDEAGGDGFLSAVEAMKALVPGTEPAAAVDQHGKTTV